MDPLADKPVWTTSVNTGLICVREAYRKYGEKRQRTGFKRAEGGGMSLVAGPRHVSLEMPQTRGQIHASRPHREARGHLIGRSGVRLRA